MKTEEEESNGEYQCIKVTDRNHLFIQEYLIDYKPMEAAIRAGYSPATAAQTASRLLNQKLIIEEIDKYKKMDAERYEIKKELIVKEIFDVISKCKDKGDSNNLLKALDMLNKMAGHYSQTVTNINIEIPLFPDIE